MSMSILDSKMANYKNPPETSVRSLTRNSSWSVANRSSKPPPPHSPAKKQKTKHKTEIETRNRNNHYLFKSYHSFCLYCDAIFIIITFMRFIFGFVCLFACFFFSHIFPLILTFLVFISVRFRIFAFIFVCVCVCATISERRYIAGCANRRTRHTHGFKYITIVGLRT